MKDGTIAEISGLEFEWWSVWRRRASNRWLFHPFNYLPLKSNFWKPSITLWFLFSNSGIFFSLLQSSANKAWNGRIGWRWLRWLLRWGGWRWVSFCWGHIIEIFSWITPLDTLFRHKRVRISHDSCLFLIPSGRGMYFFLNLRAVLRNWRDGSFVRRFIIHHFWFFLPFDPLSQQQSDL